MGSSVLKAVSTTTNKDELFGFWAEFWLLGAKVWCLNIDIEYAMDKRIQMKTSWDGDWPCVWGVLVCHVQHKTALSCEWEALVLIYVISNLPTNLFSHVPTLHSFKRRVIFVCLCRHLCSGAQLPLHCSVPTTCYAAWSQSPKTSVRLCPMIANIFTRLKANIICSVHGGNPVFGLEIDGLFT